ncbi:hypothetical protein BC828DRAFT_381290 [Blastocladiella britannica]|nr:hypothetical protein BC828DRAFT_381290 [Blastocladiella britannica]
MLTRFTRFTRMQLANRSLLPLLSGVVSPSRTAGITVQHQVRAFASEPPSTSPDNQLAILAAKLQSSPEFLRAVADFQDALKAKGLTQDELAKPSFKLIKVMMDKDVKAATEKMAEAMKTAGVTNDEIRAAAQSFGGAGGLAGLFGDMSGGSKPRE